MQKIARYIVYTNHENALVLDPSNKTLCDNALSLLHRIRGLSVLWKAPKLFENTIEIKDGDASLSVRDPLQQSDADNSSGSLSAKSFVISLSGKYERIEPLRVPLSSFIKDQGFEHRYIIRDDASEEIACKLYPYLYQIETLLRGL